jgi:hypothetical protein
MKLDVNADIKYDKQDQQEKAAFNERNPHMIQQQEPAARSPDGPQCLLLNVCHIFMPICLSILPTK